MPKQSKNMVKPQDDFILSLELEERIEEGRRQYKEGNVTVCTTKEELNKLLASSHDPTHEDGL